MNRAQQRLIEEIKTEIKITSPYTGVKALSPETLDALQKVPRDKFVTEMDKDFAFDNRPLSIGHGQTISQPYIVAIMTELLNLQPQFRVLEVGTGSGYQAAVLSRIVDKVYSIERIYALYKSATERFRKMGYDNIETLYGDGHAGWSENAPYDGIIVTAAASSIPLALVEQLKPGANLVIPVGARFGQELIVVKKLDDGSVKQNKVLDVAFVPLTDGCVKS